MNANNRQVGGQHYASQYQHWDFVRLCLGNRYLEGCVTKYVARWRKKNGLQDLEKALHYLDKIIELFDGELYESLPARDFDVLRDHNATPEDFCRANELGARESFVVKGLTYWNNGFVLLDIRATLLELIEEAKAEDARRQALKAGAGGGIGGPGPRASLGTTAYARDVEAHGDEPGPAYVNQD